MVIDELWLRLWQEETSLCDGKMRRKKVFSHLMTPGLPSCLGRKIGIKIRITIMIVRITGMPEGLLPLNPHNLQGFLHESSLMPKIQVHFQQDILALLLPVSHDRYFSGRNFDSFFSKCCNSNPVSPSITNYQWAYGWKLSPFVFWINVFDFMPNI